MYFTRRKAIQNLEVASDNFLESPYSILKIRPHGFILIFTGWAISIMLGRNVITLFSFGLFYSVMVLVNVSFADQLRFPAESDNELLGHFTYEIPPNSWTSKLRKLLPRNNNYALEFRKNKNYEVVFLLHVETTLEDCKKEYEFCSDRIIAVLKVPEHASNEAINFNCRLKRGKSQSDDVVFGIVKNSKIPGYFSPRLAWLVKFETLTFEPVDGEGVECGLFGLD